MNRRSLFLGAATCSLASGRPSAARNPRGAASLAAWVYGTRRDAVLDIAAIRDLPVGAIFFAGGLGYLIMPEGHPAYGTDPIAELPGVAPLDIAHFEHFGAVGDGATDDANAIQLAQDYVVSIGGGPLTGRSLVYSVDAVRVCDAAGRLGNIALGDGVHLYGHFTIRRGAAANASRAIIFIQEAFGGSIKGIEIDANDTAISSPTIHGIYKNRNLSDYTIEGVTIRNSSAYGLGLQDDDTVGAYAYTKNCRFSNIWIYDSGNDGIDMKDSHAETGVCVFENILVDGFGLNAGATGRVGLHTRGSGNFLRGITIRNPGPAALRGIAMQTTGTLLGNAKRSRLSEFNVDVSGQAGVQAVAVQNAYADLVSGDCLPGRGGIGVLIDSAHAKVTSVTSYTADAAGTGFRTVDTGDTHALFTACEGDGFDQNFVIEGDNTHLINCISLNSVKRGVRFARGLKNISMIGGFVSVAGGSKIVDYSGAARISDVLGSGFIARR